MTDTSSHKRVLLIVGGGIAAYKALELTRLMRKAGIGVRPVLTTAGAQFVTPLSLGALAEDKVYADLFSLTDEAEMGHIELSRSADLVVVAPATADLMAKAANGLAGDLASTVLLATDKPVLMAPAMNVRMWLHPATQRNLKTLQADGVAFVGPDEGAMACGEFGPGRMAEPQAILAVVQRMLAPAAQPLAGRHVLITAGPTAEPLDPVRVLTNRSSGKQGYAIAGALAGLGARVTLVSGPVAIAAPPGVTRVDVETADQMLAACRAALPADAAVFVAAVADWRPDEAFGVKLKKGKDGPPVVRLVENPDILATLSARGPARPRLVVGFAAETNDLEANARDKLSRKGCDWVVANDVSQDGIMGGDDNEVLLVSADKTERWEKASKAEVARRLAARIAEALA
ncbi:MAG TPA: bifunctional phosphopantothenoylcysteine decarboxylase/phosphopantothenate--cysteine ligase CoaBC [Caulobacteraceae bacterium]|nr:bifunctional phosphopantothenoylcysteine decarboxylase/phosphopantothenate--cysteine ligase CoaBC [Caulobacteraceae bacterium]